MLKEEIQNNLIAAVKGKEELTSSVLRLLLSAIFNKEKEKRYKLSKEPGIAIEELEKESALTDEEVVEVISSEIKKRKESILEFEKGKRQDLVSKEKKEKEILEKYLPTREAGTRLPEEELQKLAKEVIKKIGAKEPKDIGKVMQELMPKVKGKADGSLVSKIVKELLS